MEKRGNSTGAARRPEWFATLQFSSRDKLGIPTGPNAERRGVDHESELWPTEHHGPLIPNKLLLVYIYERCDARTVKPSYPAS